MHKIILASIFLQKKYEKSVVLADFQVVLLPVSFGGKSEGTPESLSVQKYGMILVWFGIGPQILSQNPQIPQNPSKSTPDCPTNLKNLSDPINAAAILRFDLCCSLTFGYAPPCRTVSDNGVVRSAKCRMAFMNAATPRGCCCSSQCTSRKRRLHTTSLLVSKPPDID